MDLFEIQPRQGPSRCSYCHTGVEFDSWACPECRTQLHVACLAELGRCPTAGCAHEPATRTLLGQASGRERRSEEESAPRSWNLKLRAGALVVSLVAAFWLVEGSAISYSKYAHTLGPTLSKAYFGFLIMLCVVGPQVLLSTSKAEGTNWSWDRED